MRRITLAAAIVVGVAQAEAAIVQIDYSFDAANGNFFGLNPLAKAAVDAAAQDLNNVVGNSLQAITTDVYQRSSGGATATIDWKLNFSDPSTGADVEQLVFNAPVNLVTVYAGVRPLSGLTLGVGGPAGAGTSIGISGNSSGFSSALSAAENASNAAMPRGAGPIIGTLSGNAGGNNYTLNYGAIRGSLSFDSDANNDGTADDAAALANYWHYDHTAPVTAGKNDFYSVALHEIIHAIGIGTSETWESLRNGTDWLGSNVIALTGSGTGKVSADFGHIADGLMSTTLSGGTAQEAVMDPSITQGTRKFLTAVDAAFLRDLGYIAVPEPSTAALLCATGFVLGLVRRRNERAPFA